jgi:hypothetical protein
VAAPILKGATFRVVELGSALRLIQRSIVIVKRTSYQDRGGEIQRFITFEGWIPYQVRDRLRGTAPITILEHKVPLMAPSHAQDSLDYSTSHINLELLLSFLPSLHFTHFAAVTASNALVLVQSHSRDQKVEGLERLDSVLVHHESDLIAQLCHILNQSKHTRQLSGCLDQNPESWNDGTHRHVT